jgi:hypothetical protein
MERRSTKPSWMALIVMSSLLLLSLFFLTSPPSPPHDSYDRDSFLWSFEDNPLRTEKSEDYLSSVRSHDHINTSSRSTTGRYDALCLSSLVSSSPLGWEFAGPTTYVSAFGDDEDDGAPKLASAAAVQNVVQAANDTWFMGSVNGGIWRSTTFHSTKKVRWKNVLDGQPVTCTSMSALHVSSTNPNTIYAGCGGSTSGEQGTDWNVVNSGDWGGIMVSTDLGESWRMMQGFPENYYVTDILEISAQGNKNNNDSKKIILVAAQSHLWDRNDGGIWRSIDGGITFERVCRHPTFTLTLLQPNSDASSIHQSKSQTIILATHAHSAVYTASLSQDAGETFQDLQLPWQEGAVPFYTCAAQLVGGEIIVGGLTRLAGGLPNHTDSQLFVLSQSVIEVRNGTNPLHGWFELDQPMRMDQDSMPKDRMALLADPLYADLFYVAGNAEALAWRVNISSGAWTKLWDEPDVVDGSIPHGDCRNYAWDEPKDGTLGRLILVSDGGIFARIQPREPGGRWVSLNGDYSALELVSARYDPQDDRYVAGAQDNCAIVTKPMARPQDVGLGFVEGDGTVTAVDSSAHPSRLFGTTQFLGVGTIDDDPKSGSGSQGEDIHDDDDDQNCGGFCFVQGENFVQIPLEDYFPDPSSFPFFVHPYTLNRQDPSLLHIWVNGTAQGQLPGQRQTNDGSGGAFYEFRISYSVIDKDDIGPPTKLLDTPPGALILDFVSGGITNGKDNPNFLLAVSNTHLYIRRQALESLVVRPLPVPFAMPVTLEYDWSSSSRILGPLTHHRTIFLAVNPSHSEIVAVTGWQDIESNMGDEAIFVTVDGGDTWKNVTGNLRQASGVCGKVRPSGLLWLNLSMRRNGDDFTEKIEEDRRSNQNWALLVGTSNGIFVSMIDTSELLPDSLDASLGNDAQPETSLPKWKRLGTCNEFPMVLVSDVNYNVESDRLVAATYGRGIFVLKNAREKLRGWVH